jgi:hypothetical protein
MLGNIRKARLLHLASLLQGLLIMFMYRTGMLGQLVRGGLYAGRIRVALLHFLKYFDEIPFHLGVPRSTAPV